MQHRLGHKLYKKDLEFDIDDLRTELADSIKYEEHRDNVDRAKKTAVKQFMNYDGFHQMVLGADLKPVKSTELKELVDMNNKRIDRIFNPLKNDQNAQEEDLDINQMLNKIKVEPELKPTSKGIELEEELAKIPKPKNFREFRKIYDKLFNREKADEDDKIRLLEWLSILPRDHNEEIYGVDFDVGYLMVVVDILLVWVKDEDCWVNYRKYFAWFLEFLGELMKVNTFDFGIKAMMKSSEKILVRKVLDLIGKRNEVFVEFVGDLKKGFK